MDYNFNLKHESQKKFGMAPFLSGPGFNRCFSTSGKISVSPCGTDKLPMDPLKFVNFISGLHNNSPKNSKCGMPETSLSQSNSFTGTAGVSVSCFVSGFVGGNSRPQQTPGYCNGLLLDVLLNEINTLEDANHCSNSSTGNNSNSPKTIANTKRTYAEVTKEKPKSPGAKSNSNSTAACDNFTRFRCNNACPISAVKENKAETQSLIDAKLYSPNRCVRQKSISSSSESSLDSERKSRTVSECSVDSDDSYIVFENDDEGTVLDYAEEDASSDCSEEAGDHSPRCNGNISSDSGSSNKSKKKVMFKTDEELVTVHLFEDCEFGNRAGPWEQYARDRVRFHDRIQNLSRVINPVFSEVHREDVYRKRFMT